MVIAIIVAFRSERESRSAIFPIVREEEAIRAKRARIYIFVWAAVAALFLGGWLAAAGLLRQTPNQSAAQSGEAAAALVSDPNQTLAPVAPAALPAVTPEVVPTETPLPPTPAALSDAGPATLAPTATNPPPNPTPTVTPLPATVTPTATFSPPPPTATSAPPTATATPPASVLVRAPTTGPRTPAPAGARMGPIQFGTGITGEVEAINPDTLFPQGTSEVYAVFPYSGMQNGLDFKVIWYQNGKELWREENEWEWGDEARFFSFFRTPPEGLYKVELYVNDSILATGLFEVR
jgi:hypothetical protein